MPCPYSEALGIPGKGVHARRFLGFAFNDILMTIVAALLTAYVFNIPAWKSFLAWFVAGEVLHYIFGVNSTFLQTIGLSPTC